MFTQGRKFKVSNDGVEDEEADLLIQTLTRPRKFGEAVGAIVGWPKERMPNLYQCSCQAKQFKEIAKNLPMQCKFLYSYIFHLMPKNESMQIELENCMFGYPKTI